MLDVVTGILGAVGSGGVTGLLGGGLTFLQQKSANKQKLKELELNNKYKKEILELEQAMAKEEQQADIRVEQIEGENERYLADSEAMIASFQHALGDKGDTANEGIILRFVEGMRRAVRPIASYYSMAVLTMLTWWMIDLWNSKGLELSNEQAYTISLQLLNATVYLTTTILLWWFSSRGVKLHIGK